MFKWTTGDECHQVFWFDMDWHLNISCRHYSLATKKLSWFLSNHNTQPRGYFLPCHELKLCKLCFWFVKLSWCLHLQDWCQFPPIQVAWQSWKSQKNPWNNYLPWHQCPNFCCQWGPTWSWAWCWNRTRRFCWIWWFWYCTKECDNHFLCCLWQILKIVVGPLQRSLLHTRHGCFGRIFLSWFFCQSLELWS